MNLGSKRKVQLREQERLERIEKDRAFVLTPDNWPKWPLLPLVRRDGESSADDFAAVLLAGEARTNVFIAYSGNLFGLNDIAKEVEAETGKHPSWRLVLNKLNARRFDSLDELLAYYRID